MMGSSELFAQFINNRGLETLLDNMDIRGIEHLKAQAAEFMREQEEAKRAASQEPSPIQVEAEALKEIEGMKVEQRAIEAEGKLAVSTAEVAVKKQVADTAQMKLLAEIEAKGVDQQMQQQKVDSDIATGAIKAAVDLSEALHERTEAIEVGVEKL
jgi:hypothetical protein